MSIIQHSTVEPVVDGDWYTAMADLIEVARIDDLPKPAQTVWDAGSGQIRVWLDHPASFDRWAKSLRVGAVEQGSSFWGWRRTMAWGRLDSSTGSGVTLLLGLPDTWSDCPNCEVAVDASDPNQWTTCGHCRSCGCGECLGEPFGGAW